MAAKKRDDALLVALLASGSTIKDAGEATGISVRTIGRRLTDAGFRQQVAGARTRLLEEATSVLAGHAAQAARVLGRLLASEDEKTRLHAARVLLSQSLDLAEATDIQARIEALEGCRDGNS